MLLYWHSSHSGQAPNALEFFSLIYLTTINLVEWLLSVEWTKRCLTCPIIISQDYYILKCSKTVSIYTVVTSPVAQHQQAPGLANRPTNKSNRRLFLDCFCSACPRAFWLLSCCPFPVLNPQPHVYTLSLWWIVF